MQSVLETFHRDCFELNHTAIYSKQSALDQSGIVCHVLCGYNTDRACVVTEENEGDVVLHGVKTEPHSETLLCGSVFTPYNTTSPSCVFFHLQFLG